MRIAIVNDMLLAVEAMRRAVLMRPSPPTVVSPLGGEADTSASRAGGHQIAWIARDGAEAVELCAKDRPDLILMDLIMPVMDGVEATRRIMAASPCAIVVVTANVHDNTAQVFEAMGAGALDAVNTPVLQQPGNVDGVRALLTKIETVGKLIGASTERPREASPVAPRAADAKASQLVVIGASAGGPAALAQIFAGLPVDFPAGIVVVQHVDEHFAEGLRAWLAGHTRLPVKLVAQGDSPKAGTILLGGKEQHLVLVNPLHLGYTTYPEDVSYRPSIDVFFKTVSRHWSGTVIGVLLTGMGRDGAAGLKALKEAGHFTIAQDKASSAVYGMPKAAADLDAATEILTLDKIAARLTNIVTKRPTVVWPTISINRH